MVAWEVGEGDYLFSRSLAPLRRFHEPNCGTELRRASYLARCDQLRAGADRKAKLSHGRGMPPADAPPFEYHSSRRRRLRCNRDASALPCRGPFAHPGTKPQIG